MRRTPLWPRGARTRPLVAIALAGGALLAAGCSVSVGDSDDLNTGEAETLIEDGYQMVGNVTVDVACPDDVEAEAEATFTCEVTGPTGATADIEVRQVDDEGNIRFGYVPVGLNPNALEAQIAEEVRRQENATVDVDCPDAIAAEQGNVFSCTVTDTQGTTVEAEVTQNDDEGNVTWRLVQP